MTNPLEGMTQDRWDNMPLSERTKILDLGGLSPQLVGLEGCRVEVVATNGETRRFIVGRSTGWRPCHLEIKTRRSYGGSPADQKYSRITKIEKVR